MTAFESPELVDLFTTYAASPTSIAAHFNATTAEATQDEPLIVASGTDIAVFPGGGRPPVIQAIRTGSRGFKELAGISHLGPAVASLMTMKELEPNGLWRADAERLIRAVQRARRANSVELWRDQIAVSAFAGREEAIASLVDYSCDLTEAYVTRALTNPDYLRPETLRSDYLEGPSAFALPVPFNRVMIATFFLTGLDIAHRTISWFDQLELPWERTMVIMVGRTGKPTGAVTRETHSIAGIIDDASRHRLPDTSLLIAPHVPVFPTYDGENGEVIATFEQQYRQLWSGLVSVAHLGPKMFDGYPEYHPRPWGETTIVDGQKTISDMPAIRDPQDWLAMTARLRIVLEDPRQLLSSAITDYASGQLIEHDNDPRAVTVPGLDGEPYPAQPATSRG
ncbi:hypothetical protein BWI15_00100 [Kribbella sp. ALI-6-A]|uniref:DUF5624 domain-containing protein n=1 Tax=Kribbella sp. ALI-6-A TaxID=1933817 RepID=UPI00097CAE33|nr:DUF5624 domain-containing protein [Kribbella sp. ALI-6-A]ONI79084.1 hypothetical protein BWI15_00100 [Kribbella sp. ALI-6-A]